MTLHTFLNFDGNCEQAFRFDERHLLRDKFGISWMLLAHTPGA